MSNKVDFDSELSQVMGYSDTDVAEYLYSNKPQIDSLTKFLCKDLTKACSTKPPPVPKVTTLSFSYISSFFIYRSFLVIALGSIFFPLDINKHASDVKSLIFDCKIHPRFHAFS